MMGVKGVSEISIERLGHRRATAVSHIAGLFDYTFLPWCE